LKLRDAHFGALSLLLFVVAACHPSAPSAPSGEGLTVSLAIATPSLLYQQDTNCTVTLHNSGAGPVEVLVPPLEETLPIVHMRDVRTGEEKIYRRQPSPKGAVFESGQLPPGESVETGFKLLDVVPSLATGEYDTRVAWEYDGDTGLAESQPVRVKVVPTTPAHLRLADAVGGRGVVKYGVWLNRSGDPPQIVRNRFTLRAGGGVSHLLPVAECERGSRPALSAPAVGKVARSQWVAWVDRGTLRFTHVDDKLGVAAVQSFPLSVEAAIVVPLFSAEEVDTTVRPVGGALLMATGPNRDHFRLRSLRLTPEGAIPLGETTLPGPLPGWIMSHARSAGDRFVTYLQATDGRTTLHRAPWPGFGEGGDVGARLVEWSGKFVAAGAAIDAGGVVHGGTLLWTAGEAGDGTLMLIGWTVHPDGGYREVHRRAVDWDPARPILVAKMAVSQRGDLAVLVGVNEDGWYVYTGDLGLRPLPAKIQPANDALEVGFLDGVGEPLLIIGTQSHGWLTTRLDGSPLPAYPSK